MHLLYRLNKLMVIAKSTGNYFKFITQKKAKHFICRKKMQITNWNITMHTWCMFTKAENPSE